MRNPTEHPIHPLLAERWSPYAFDPRREVDPADLRSLFEAARWSMSSHNAQPWRYIVGVRAQDPALWQRLFEVLLEGNRQWAGNAPVLVLASAEHRFEYNGKPNKAAIYDLGGACAMLTVEAAARGLGVHQMIGIDPDKTREVFSLGPDVEPFTALAIGYPGSPDDVVEPYATRDRRVRERKPLEELLLEGSV